MAEKEEEDKKKTSLKEKEKRSSPFAGMRHDVRIWLARVGQAIRADAGTDAMADPYRMRCFGPPPTDSADRISGLYYQPYSWLCAAGIDPSFMISVLTVETNAKNTKGNKGNKKQTKKTVGRKSVLGALTKGETFLFVLESWLWILSLSFLYHFGKKTRTTQLCTNGQICEWVSGQKGNSHTRTQTTRREPQNC